MYYDHIDKIFEITKVDSESDLDDIIEFVGTNGVRTSRNKRYLWSDEYSECVGIALATQGVEPGTLLHVSAAFTPY